MMAFMQAINGAAKGQQNVQNAVDFDIFKSTLNLIANSRACDGAFRDETGQPVRLTYVGAMVPGTSILSPAAPLAVAKLYFGATPLATPGMPMGAGMKLSKLEFVEAIYERDVVVGAVTYRSFAALLHVEATKQIGAQGGAGYATNLGVHVLAGFANGSIEKCVE